MSKFTPNTFTNLNNETSFINQLNANFSTLQTLLDTMVSRDGTTPNTMTADFDVNSQDVLNVNNAYVQTLFINGSEVVPTDLANVPATEIPVGTVGAPGLAVDGDADTGFFQDTLNTLAISIGGSEVFRAKSTGIDVVGDVICTDDMSCDRITAASMTITTGGLVISAGGLNVTGTVTLPAFTIATGSVATTAAANDNSTKVATTAYVDTAIAALPGATTYAHLRAYRNSTQQAITNATTTTIVFNAEEYDTATAYNTTTGEFTVPANGYYLIGANIQCESVSWTSPTEWAVISVYVDGVETLAGRTFRPVSGTHDSAFDVKGTLSLTAGEVVTVRFTHTAGVTMDVDPGATITYLTIDRIP